MAPSRPSYDFGPFRLDAGSRRLLRDGEPLSLPDRQLEILLAFVDQPGVVLSKDTLMTRAWPDVTVGDNSLEQAVSALRRLLGPGAIETLARRGYRFGLPVTRTTARADADALEALLRPHRALLEGRTALESLDREAVGRARVVFEHLVRETPEYAPGHLGLANALAFRFEASRAGCEPDTPALAAAIDHARQACALDPGAGEAWATLAFVLHRAGASIDAVAAGRRAIALEPDNWRHHVRLAYVAWGEERLRAARRALTLLPGLALAHWLAATVLVARQSLEEAERELVAGAAAQDRASSTFGAVGLHLLLGLVRLARHDTPGGIAELERELAFADSGHLYAREACANTWCALGHVRRRAGDGAGARDAFTHALALVPGFPPARLALDGTAARAPEQVLHALANAAPGPDDWMLPVDPAFDVTENPDVWADVLALLRMRAS
ncbi:MAG: winged helix-turn-helix domain-containing protein [Vicinamibacterales bacterium]